MGKKKFTTQGLRSYVFIYIYIFLRDWWNAILNTWRKTASAYFSASNGLTVFTLLSKYPDSHNKANTARSTLSVRSMLKKQLKQFCSLYSKWHFQPSSFGFIQYAVTIKVSVFSSYSHFELVKLDSCNSESALIIWLHLICWGSHLGHQRAEVAGSLCQQCDSYIKPWSWHYPLRGH